MSEPTTSIFLSASTPAPFAGYQDASFQSDAGTPQQKVSAQVPNTGGAAVKTANYTLLASDCGLLIVANSASAITFTLPASIPFSQWQVKVANIGAGVLSVVAGGSLTIDGSGAGISLPQTVGFSIATDGNNYFSERGGWREYTDPNLLPAIAGITIDGGGSTPGLGIKGFLQIPYAGTIVGWTMLADQAGSTSIEVWKVASSAPPASPAVPTSSNLISAAAPPALSSAQSAAVGTAGVSTWTTAVAAYDVFGFKLDSAATITRVTLQILIQKI